MKINLINSELKELRHRKSARIGHFVLQDESND